MLFLPTIPVPFIPWESLPVCACLETNAGKSFQTICRLLSNMPEVHSPASGTFMPNNAENFQRCISPLPCEICSVALEDSDRSLCCLLSLFHFSLTATSVRFSRHKEWKSHLKLPLLKQILPSQQVHHLGLMIFVPRRNILCFCLCSFHPVSSKAF